MISSQIVPPATTGSVTLIVSNPKSYPNGNPDSARATRSIVVAATSASGISGSVACSA
jgi:hypothetical protein